MSNMSGLDVRGFGNGLFIYSFLIALGIPMVPDSDAWRIFIGSAMHSRSHFHCTWGSFFDKVFNSGQKKVEKLTTKKYPNSLIFIKLQSTEQNMVPRIKPLFFLVVMVLLTNPMLDRVFGADDFDLEPL